jgi:hypothetical protein
VRHPQAVIEQSELREDDEPDPRRAFEASCEAIRRIGPGSVPEASVDGLRRPREPTDELCLVEMCELIHDGTCPLTTK